MLHATVLHLQAIALIMRLHTSPSSSFWPIFDHAACNQLCVCSQLGLKGRLLLNMLQAALHCCLLSLFSGALQLFFTSILTFAAVGCGSICVIACSLGQRDIAGIEQGVELWCCVLQGSCKWHNSAAAVAQRCPRHGEVNCVQTSAVI